MEKGLLIIFAIALACTDCSAFQVGWWTDIYEPSKLAGYAAEGNTLVLAYGGGWFTSTSDRVKIKTYLDEADRQGIKVIVAMTKERNTPYGVPVQEFSETVSEFRNHPALYSWYLADEPELYTGGWEETHSYLAANPGYYSLVKSVDTSNPVFITHDYNRRELASSFFDVTDITGMHAYPFWSIDSEFARSDGRMLYDMWKEQIDEARGDGKDFIATCQGFGDNTQYPYRDPTINELRYQVFTAMALGADKILFWYDGWASDSMKAKVRTVMGEIQQVGDEINQGVTNDPAIGVSGNLVADGKLIFRHGAYSGTHAIVAVNIANRESENGLALNAVRFTLPSGASSVEVIGEQRSIPVVDNAFTDSFSRFQVHIYGFNSGCNGGADADCNGCISQVELLGYVNFWKSGNAGLANLMEAIGKWKNGC